MVVRLGAPRFTEHVPQDHEAELGILVQLAAWLLLWAEHARHERFVAQQLFERDADALAPRGSWFGLQEVTGPTAELFDALRHGCAFM
jgi:hypothetical protein